MTVAAKEVFESMNKLPQFKVDKNLWLNVFMDRNHGFDAFMARIWHTFRTLSIGRSYVERL